MLRQIWKYPSEGINQLRSFVHPNHYREVDEELIVAINNLEQDDALWYLRQMKNPSWVKTIGHREVNVIVTATTIDTHEQIEIQALIDSGCMTSAISNRLVERQKMNTIKLPRAIGATNADGSKNSGGMITDMVRLRIRIMEHEEIMEFLVLDLGKQDMFLGHDWLQFHNPEIDWKNEKLKFTRCPQECFPETMALEPEDEMEPMDPNEDRILAVHIGYEELLPHLTIEEIRAKSNFATDIAEAQQKTRTWEEIVPPAYRKFNKVFEKKTFDALPPRRPWDHAIEIIPGSKMVDCKIYPLNPQEQKELDEFLKEQLETGRIRSSKSPMASPFFFVKKKDGKL